MYYPEANRLVPTTIDPDSKTPAFKSVVITVEPESVLGPVNGAPESARRSLSVVQGVRSI
jgi:hypothetical protein